MIFGEIKGFSVDRSLNHTLVTVCLVASIYCMLGFISGMIELDANFDSRVKPFEWDLARVLYLLGELVAFAAGWFFARAYEDADTRVGAVAIMALPLAIVSYMSVGLLTGWLG